MLYKSVGWRQPGPATVPEGLALLQKLRGQGLGVGAETGRSGRILTQPEPDPEKVGVPGTHLWKRSPAQGAGKIQEGG